MQHLISALLHQQNLGWVGLLFGEASLVSAAAIGLLMWSPSLLRTRALQVALFSAAVSTGSWIAFRFAFFASFPRLDFAVPGWHSAFALASAAIGSAGAALIYLRARLSARDAVLAGSLLACGVSCMVFTGMAAIVQPFALAYNLSAVLATMAIGAALAGFALWEAGNPGRRRPWAGWCLLLLAIPLLASGSLASMLPFDGWIEVSKDKDSLASSPITILVIAELVTVLILAFVGSLLDNHAVLRNRRESERLGQLADSTFEGILIHKDGWILDANARLTGMLKRSLPEIRGTHLRQYMAMPHWNSLESHMNAGGDHDPRPAEIEIIGADGVCLPVEALSRPIAYANGVAQVMAMRDVRERREAEERIRFLAHHDVLTELPNRLLLNESVQQVLFMAARSCSTVSVFYMDLDGFKLINDTMGHQAGDMLLRQVADRLRANVRETDIVARVGGDEFVVVQQDRAQTGAAALLAERLIDCMRMPFDLAGQLATLGISIGIASYPDHGTDAVMLLKNADIALYRAKEGGRSRFCHYETGMDLALKDRRDLEQDLRAAIDAEELSLNFQPLYNHAGKLVSFEALVRWMHPERGPISPARFIPLAEECGLIAQLGTWVLRRACQAAAGWQADCRISVNLSPAQFHHGNLPDLVAQVLRETGLPVSRLELEVTEGLLIKDTEHALNMLELLRGSGARIVLDDFGTGYSSLSYLHRFPFDKLKIDQSFTRRLDTDTGARAIVGAIVAMGRSLNLAVTAEGVETASQLALLREHACDEFQGYLLGKPMPEASVPDYLVRHPSLIKPEWFVDELPANDDGRPSLPGTA